MNREKRIKINKEDFWKIILLVIILVLIIYFLSNWIVSKEKNEDYENCMEDCEDERQTCILSLGVIDCMYYFEECIEDCVE